MMWGIFWRPRDKGPWRPWTDRLFTSRTAAWDYVLQDRGYRPIEGRLGWVTRGSVMSPTDVKRKAAIQYEMRRIGLRLCPARIVPEAPNVYLPEDR